MAKNKQQTQARQVPVSGKTEIKMLDSLTIEGEKLESGKRYTLAPYIQTTLVRRGHAEYVGSDSK